LKTKNKLGFIEGTVKRPNLKERDDPTKYNAWEMVNLMICYWIINLIDPKLHTSIDYVETVVVMWENLRKIYAVAKTPKIHQLKTDIVKCKHRGLDVVEFYSKLMGMWSELSNYIKISQCTCEKCKCGVGSKVMKMLKEEQTHQFLKGLTDETYTNIRS